MIPAGSLRAWVALLALHLVSGSIAAQGAGDTRLVYSHRIVGVSSGAAPDGGPARDALVFRRAALRAVGWHLPARTDAGPSRHDRLEARDGRLLVTLERPAFLARDGPAAAWKIHLDDRFRLDPVDAEDGRSAVLLPAGRHALRVLERPVGMRRLAWWGGLLGACLLQVLLVLLAHRLLARVDRTSWPKRPGPRRVHVLLLAAVTLITWSWTLALPPVGMDYLLVDHAGRVPSGALQHLPELPRAESFLVADTPVFRPLQTLVTWLGLQPFGPSGTFLHLLGLAGHLAGVLLLHQLLARHVQAGAALAGALVGGTWPVAAQALTWINANVLPFSVALALGATLALTHYLRSGSRPALLTGACALLLACGLKETSLTFVVVVPLAARLLAGSGHRRRLAVSFLAAASGAAIYTGIRLVAGYGIPQRFGGPGVLFSSRLDLFLAACENLPQVVLGGFAVHVGDPQVAWPGWCTAVVLMLLGLLAGARRCMAAGAFILLALITTLPDAVFHESWRAASMTRKAYPLVLVAWTLLAAMGWAGLARAGPFARPARIVLLVGLAALVTWGHLREAPYRRSISEPELRWVRAYAAELNRADEEGPREERAPRGPAASLLTLGSWADRMGERPGTVLHALPYHPFTRRPWQAFHAARPTLAGSDTRLRGWPWQLLWLEVRDGDFVPETRALLPALRGNLPLAVPVRNAAFVKDHWSLHLGSPPVCPREVRRLSLVFGRSYKRGARLEITQRSGETEHRLARTRLAHSIRRGVPVDWCTDHADAFVLASGMPELEICFTPSEKRSFPALPPVQVTLHDDLPAVRWRIARGSQATWPLALSWSVRHPPETFRVSLEAEGGTFQGDLRPVKLDLTAMTLDRTEDADGHTYRVDLLPGLRIDLATWSEVLKRIRERHPRVDGFYVRLRMEALRGSPGWLQARSPMLRLWLAL